MFKTPAVFKIEKKELFKINNMGFVENIDRV